MMSALLYFGLEWFYSLVNSKSLVESLSRDWLYFLNVVFNYQFLLVIILFGCILPSVCEGVAIWSIKLDTLPAFGSPSKFSGQETPFLDVIKNRRHPSV